MTKLLSLLIALIFTVPGFSQDYSVDRVEPGNWWTGMKWSPLQLLVYGKNLKGSTVTTSSADLVVLKTTGAQSNNYLFVDLEFKSTLQPGTYQIKFNKDGNEPVVVDFPVYARQSGPDRHTGFSPDDVMYLITPDRFSNGDPTNDKIEGLKEGVNRADGDSRHGGDIQGIINKLDYIQSMGFTAIWINPLIENRGLFSYHGYATTDLYRIDARFGTNELYKELVDQARKRGMKIILDHVNNHIGIEHWLMNDLPFEDWVHGTAKTYVSPVHQKENLIDINGDRRSRDIEQTGWFAPYMPDLNQRNPFVANYLIQNTLWWIEFSGLHGIREDTYPYVYFDYGAKWNEAIKADYPSLTVVGEVWIENPVFVSVFQKGNPLAPYDTKMESITDFGFYGGAKNLFGKNPDPSRLYHTFTQDFLYPNPGNLLTFLDNHDVARIMHKADENVDQAFMALGLLMTVRGIPCVYYGTEIGMVGGPDSDHGSLRLDFPGGWPGDKRDAFTASGRTDLENQFFNHLKTLIDLRKSSSALKHGKTVQYPPKGKLYWYLRYDEKETYLVIVNALSYDLRFDLSQIEADVRPYNTLTNVLTGEITKRDEKKVTSKTMTTTIFKLTGEQK